MRHTITVDEEKRRCNARKKIRYANRTPEEVERDREKAHQKWVDITPEQKEKHNKQSLESYHRRKNKITYTEEQRERQREYSRNWRMLHPDYDRKSYLRKSAKRVEEIKQMYYDKRGEESQHTQIQEGV